MLSVRVLDSLLQPPKLLTGYTVLIQDSLGNPVILVQETAERVTTVLTVQDGEAFNRALSVLGIKQTVHHELLEGAASDSASVPLSPSHLQEFVRAQTTRPG